MKEILEIRKNGKLIETKWVHDKEKNESEYKEFDVTNAAISKLFNGCQLADDVTLKDIFLLLNTELDLFDLVIGNWCKEIVTEGLTKPETEYNLEGYNPEQIEYLELKYTPEYEKWSDEEDELYGFLTPGFGGIGVVLKKDWEFHKKGERIQWGVSLTPTNELINIPVKLNNSFDVYEGILRSNPTKKYEPMIKFNNPKYNLGNILYGIIWELSFHGGITQRNEFSNNLKKQVKEILDGKKNNK